MSGREFIVTRHQSEMSNGGSVLKSMREFDRIIEE